MGLQNLGDLVGEFAFAISTRLAAVLEIGISSKGFWTYG
jgi:hypothetical protein